MELTKPGLLLAKIETTYGIDPAPVAANNIGVIRGLVTLDPMGNPVTRDILDSGFSKVLGSNQQLAMGIKFRTELRGNRTDGVAADISSGNIAQAIEIDPLLRACDLNSSYQPAPGTRDGNVTYVPTLPASGSAGPSVAFYFYSQSKVYKILGSKGTFKLSLASGRFGFIDWEFKGKFTTPSDSAIPGGPTFLVTKPPTWEGAVAWPAGTAVTVTAGTDTITKNAHGLQNGDRVRFGAVAMPTGLTAATWYYVVTATTNDFKVSTVPGGAAIDITSNGTTVTMESAGAIEWDGFTGPVVSKLDFDLGNQIVMRDDALSPYGVAGWVNAGRSSSASIDPESVAEAVHPIWGDHVSQRSKQLTAKVGTLTGNMAQLQLLTTISKINYEDRSGRRVQNAQLDISQDQPGRTPGSEVTLRFF
jgi:hypothetical protein